MKGVGDQMLDASVVYVGDGVEKVASGPQGVDITVWSSNGDFSAMGYVVDQLDSLIDEWFPGKPPPRLFPPPLQCVCSCYQASMTLMWRASGSCSGRCCGRCLRTS